MGGKESGRHRRRILGAKTGSAGIEGKTGVVASCLRNSWREGELNSVALGARGERHLSGEKGGREGS